MATISLAGWLRQFDREGSGGWAAGLVPLAAVLVGIVPALTAPVAGTARIHFGWSLLAGFLALVSDPR